MFNSPLYSPTSMIGPPVTRLSRFALLLPLLAPCLAFTQSFTVNGPIEPAAYRPMDATQRWQRWWSEDGGSSTIHLDAMAVALSTFSVNDPPQWGRTIGGFGRREGSEYGSLIIANSVHESMAAAAGTDTRYFACACTGLLKRSGHAVQMTFLTYNSHGKKVLDLPQFAGQYGGAMIGTMWWPRHYSPLVQGVQVGHIEMGVTGVIHIIQEFSPELKRAFHVRTRATP